MSPFTRHRLYVRKSVDCVYATFIIIVILYNLLGLSYNDFSPLPKMGHDSLYA